MGEGDGDGDCIIDHVIVHYALVITVPTYQSRRPVVAYKFKGWVGDGEVVGWLVDWQN